MNINMLKTLVDLANGEVNSISITAFYSQYPRCDSTDNDLKLLNSRGFITLLNGDNKILGIGVNRKAIDYFK